MTATVKEIATWVGGEWLGDADRVITRARPLTDAGEGDLTFVEDEKYLNAWHESKATAAVVPPGIPVNGKPIIRVKDPLMAFAVIVRRMRGRVPSPPAHRIHPSAVLHPTAVIGEDTEIGPFVVVGEKSVVGNRCVLRAGVSVGRFCTVGDDVTMHPHVVLYDETVVGHRVVIHAHAVIGADGFGYRTVKGAHVKVPQPGHCEIGDDVEIGACTTIDCGTFGATVIGRGTKIDNLVMIGHNCQIGDHNILVGQVGIAGSTTTGSHVVMAGQVGVGDHVTIGDRVTIGAKAGVHSDIPSGSRMLGTPATPDREQMKIMMCVQKLPDMRKDLKRVLEHLGLEPKSDRAPSP
jgi:UDP-3-O-[3-hydroxymyristoyl] glucosamine N-acyltransferase